MAAPRKDNVKEIILLSTEKLIKEKDINDLSLADISKNAGISKGTLYYYYKSKDEILFDVCDRFLSNQWNELIVWAGDSGKDTSLHRFVMYVLQYNILQPSLRLHMVYNALNGNEEIRSKLLRRYDEFVALLENMIIKRTNKVEGKYLAWLMLLVSDGIIQQKEMKNVNFDSSEFINKCIEYTKVLENK